MNVHFEEHIYDDWNNKCCIIKEKVNDYFTSDESGDEGEKKNGTPKKKKKPSLELYDNDLDVNTGAKIVFQHILHRQPFPAKRDELFHILICNVPNCNERAKKNAVLMKVKKLVYDVLGLNLLCLKNKTKKEYVLSQNITHEAHNMLLLSKTDHILRGFLVFLIPFFKVYQNKIPLNQLLYELEKLGSTSKKEKAEILSYVTTPNCAIMQEMNITYYAGLLMDPVDYLLCLKKMSYIDFIFDKIEETTLDGIFITTGSRFEKEINMDSFIDKLLKIPNKKYEKKNLYSLFSDYLSS